MFKLNKKTMNQVMEFTGAVVVMIGLPAVLWTYLAIFTQ